MRLTMALCLILSVLITSCNSKNEEETNFPESVKAAKGIAKRILPSHAEGFTFEEIAQDNGNDVFEIESGKDKIIISGNNGISMAMGLNWYLKEYCNCSVSLRGNNLNLPDKLPEIDGVIKKVSWAEHRYFLNYCSFGYSMPWWDWAQWERLIDYMALNGITSPLAVTGQEATWQAVCKRLGLNDEDIRNFLAGPPYLPFGWMGCLDGWGGPLPQSWIDKHQELGVKILERERELGMTPIQQGFTGHVPAVLTVKYPETEIHTINWQEWTTYILDPMDPLFQKVADIFMEEQTKRFGTDHLYAADAFIEMMPPSGELDYLNNLSKAIYNGLKQNDPEAIWVFQTWPFINKRVFWTQPRIQAFLEGVPHEHMLCLDLACEEYPQWQYANSFYGKPWIWCNIQNYGDKVFLGGGINQLNNDLIEAKLDSANFNLKGLGFVNEGLGYNPVMHDLMFEMAWRNKGVEMDSWIKRYTTYRYGKQNPDVVKAWQIMEETAYSEPGDMTGYRSVLARFPSINEMRGTYYDNSQLAGAWKYLLKASDELGSVDSYQFDLVNIARQVLANHVSDLHSIIRKAYNEKDIASLKATSGEFLQLLLDIDKLVGTREELLLGKTLEDAKRWGTTPEEKAILEWNARRVLTLWGTKSVNDYARKEWSGLISGYYYIRWERFFKELEKSLVTGVPFDQQRFKAELQEWMENWSDRKETYPDKPENLSIEVAQDLWEKYGQKLYQ